MPDVLQVSWYVFFLIWLSQQWSKQGSSPAPLYRLREVGRATPLEGDLLASGGVDIKPSSSLVWQQYACLHNCARSHLNDLKFLKFQRGWPLWHKVSAAGKFSRWLLESGVDSKFLGVILTFRTSTPLLTALWGLPFQPQGTQPNGSYSQVGNFLRSPVGASTPEPWSLKKGEGDRDEKEAGDRWRRWSVTLVFLWLQPMADN